jgi:hypothetical protein
MLQSMSRAVVWWVTRSPGANEGRQHHSITFTLHRSAVITHRSFVVNRLNFTAGLTIGSVPIVHCHLLFNFDPRLLSSVVSMILSRVRSHLLSLLFFFNLPTITLYRIATRTCSSTPTWIPKHVHEGLHSSRSLQPLPKYLSTLVPTAIPAQLQSKLFLR